VIAQLGVDAKAVEKQVRADIAAKVAGKPKPKPAKKEHVASKRVMRPVAKVVRARA
jgi:hypothetical protein